MWSRNASRNDKHADKCASQEYYLCIQSQRLGTDLSFSEAGGVEIEANWDKVKKVTIPTLQEPSASTLSPLLSGLPLELKDKMVNFIRGCFQVRQTNQLSHLLSAVCFKPVRRFKFCLPRSQETDSLHHCRCLRIWILRSWK